MAKNVRIVPSSGSIYLTADGYDITGSVVLRTLGNTEDLEFSTGGDQPALLISKESGRIGIGTVSASAKLEVSSSLDEDLLLIKNASGSIKVNQEGVLVLSPYQGDATAISGALIYSASNLFIGS
tara:strand:+ start:1307 stop:1681 length:375 start_codon:yes stop_codon:yes gene_type:complete